MAAALLLGSLAVVGVRGQMDACDTAGLMGAVAPLTAACCPNGDACANGPPATCPPGCADLFLPFMDT